MSYRMLKAVMVCPLPGPTRKRTEALYRFRLIHLGGAECRQLWQCDGGREVYQQALNGAGEWSCTCAADIYGQGRRCKHVKCLMQFVKPTV